MSPRHVVVDGSNIATEGRSLPSLAQLDQAVREFLAENPDDNVTVVVDASFAHRIDASELPTFEEAEAAGEVVSPPAGAIGRGDAFLLRIAEKTGATVLSNDSFQEFHGEHEWVFDRGRLVGGKPVPGVGWIFTPRTPVRGPKSREAVKEAKRKRNGDEGAAPSVTRTRSRGRKVEAAIATATDEVTASSEVTRRRRRRAGEPPAEPINEPLAFITFIAEHPLGSEVEGAVEIFSSHGAFVEAGGARCYIPLSAMGDPPPRRAREVLSRGETRAFVVQALDPLRRGVELALPGFAQISGAPTEETVDAEIHRLPEDSDADESTVAPPVKPRRGRRVAEPVAVESETEQAPAPTRKPAVKRTRKVAAAASVTPEISPTEGSVTTAAEPGEAVPATAPFKRTASRRNSSTRRAANVDAAVGGSTPAVDQASVDAAPTRRGGPRKVDAARETPAEAASAPTTGPAKVGRGRAKAAPQAVTPLPAPEPVAPARAPTRKARATPVATDPSPTGAASTRSRRAKAAPTDAAPTTTAPAAPATKKAAAARTATKKVATEAAIDKTATDKAAEVAAPQAASKKAAPRKATSTRKAPTREPATREPATREPATRDVASTGTAAVDALKRTAKKAATKDAAATTAATTRAATTKAASPKAAATKNAATKNAATKNAATKNAATRNAATRNAATRNAATRNAAGTTAGPTKAATKKAGVRKVASLAAPPVTATTREEAAPSGPRRRRTAAATNEGSSGSRARTNR